MDYKSLQLPEGIVGWIYNYSRQNYWRVAGWIEIDDLMQEGLLAAYRCRERYGDVEPAHFMRLVQRTFMNRITDLVRVSLGFDDSTKLADITPERSETDTIDRLAEPVEALQEFAMLLAELPVHLRNAVELLINDPVQFRKALRIKFDGTGDNTMSKRLARLIGWPEHLDFETELRSYLWQRQRGLLNWENSAIKARIDRLKTG
jgi:hypothetical protein